MCIAQEISLSTPILFRHSSVHAPNVALENATKAEIINTLNVKQYKAEKFWDDDNNRDGVRPESIQFKLQRKISTDTSFADVNETVIRYTGSFELTGNDASAIAGALKAGGNKQLKNDGVASPITIDNTYTFTENTTLKHSISDSTGTGNHQKDYRTGLHSTEYHRH